MRKSYNTRGALVVEQLRAELTSGDFLFFVYRNGTRAKVL